MSIHQLTDGRWFVQYPDKLRPGKKKRKYFGREPDAEEKAKAFNDSLKLGRQGRKKPKDHSAYFMDLVNEYAQGRLAHIQDSTLDNFMWKMEGVILPVFKHTRAMNMTPKKIDAYVKNRLTKSRTINQTTKTGAIRKRTIQPVKKTTVHREVSDIQAVLNWSVRRRLIAFNPLDKYEMPKRDDEIILYPSESEINAILKHSPERLTRAISISYYTGLRPGQRELYSMRWHHVDFQANTIIVKSAKKGSKYKFRIVPVHPEFISVLKQWYDEDDKPNGAIIHYRGKAVKSLKRAFATAKKNAKITRRLRMYDIRHAFASLLLKNKADLKSTSELLGHSRTDTTTRIYQHTDFRMHQDAVGKLPALNLEKAAAESSGNPKKRITKVIPFKRTATNGL
jgi:integrase